MSTRQELLDQCRELNIKGCSAKKKEEIIKILEERTGKKEEKEKEEKEIQPFLLELCQTIKKDTKRKVCANCNEMGHGVLSHECKINIENDNRNKEKIRQYILSNSEKSDEEVAEELGISNHKFKQLSVTIPIEEIILATEIKEEYIDKLIYECSLCNKKQFSAYSSRKTWKEHINICDCCWIMFEEERNMLWNAIIEYQKLHVCAICNIQKTHNLQRFHYDHLNMFDKEDSVCCMVNRGDHIETIIKEIEKCQYVCIGCHGAVTHIENKFNFTRMKTRLTKQLHYKKITIEEYDAARLKYNNIYQEKMKEIYIMLKKKSEEK